MAGKIPTYTYTNPEGFWGYRTLARSAPAMQGIASRTVGISAEGDITQDGQWTYALLTTLDDGLDTDPKQQYDYQARLTWQATNALALEVYGDQMKKDDNGKTGNTHQISARYQGNRWRTGADYVERDVHGGDNNPGDAETASVFSVINMHGWDLIGRVDRIMKPTAKGDRVAYIPFSPDAKAWVGMLAASFSVNQYFRLMPNIQYVTYDDPVNDNKSQPSDDVYLKLTVEMTLK